MLTEACAEQRPLAGPFKRHAPPPCSPPENGGCSAEALRRREPVGRWLLLNAAMAFAAAPIFALPARRAALAARMSPSATL